MPQAYPSNLPKPTGSLSGSSRSQVSSTSISRGKYQQALRFADAGEEWALSVEFDNIQFAVFKGWVHNVLKEGNLEFTISFYAGDGIQTQTCRMVDGQYTAEHFGFLDWRVQFAVRFKDVAVIT